MGRSVLIATSGLYAGGAERTVSELSSALLERGWRVGVMTLTASLTDHYVLPEKVERLALDLIKESSGPWEALLRNLTRIRRIRAGIFSFAPDVVISLIDRMNIYVLAASIGQGVPVVVSERIDPREHKIGAIWSVARRLLYPRAAGVAVQTQSVASWATGLVPADRVHVIPNFVPSLRLPRGQEREPLILSIGRLERQKGFDVLLEAFSKSQARRRGYRLMILGSGAKRGSLTALAGRLGISEAVSMPGIVKDPEAWMERASIFVLSSRYEGFPNALIEAMAMGCAVISTDCPSGPAEIVHDRVDGLLVPPENSMALASAVDELVEDVGLRLRLGRSAMKIRERLAAPRVLDSWFELIDEASDRS